MADYLPPRELWPKRVYTLPEFATYAERFNPTEELLDKTVAAGRGDRTAVLDYLSITMSHPRWLAARWHDRLGFETAEAWMAFNNAPAPLTLRANRLRTTRAALVARLAQQEVRVRQGDFAPDALIVVPVRNTVLFPGMVLPITLGRPKSIMAAQQAVRDQRQVGILLQRAAEVEDPTEIDMHRVGTLANIVRYITTPDGAHHLVCQGEQRFQIVEYLTGWPFLVAVCSVAFRMRPPTCSTVGGGGAAATVWPRRLSCARMRASSSWWLNGLVR